MWSHWAEVADKVEQDVRILEEITRQGLIWEENFRDGCWKAAGNRRDLFYWLAASGELKTGWDNAPPPYPLSDLFFVKEHWWKDKMSRFSDISETSKLAYLSDRSWFSTDRPGTALDGGFPISSQSKNR